MTDAHLHHQNLGVLVVIAAYLLYVPRNTASTAGRQPMARRKPVLSTYEITQPWVIYHFELTHDRWWPLHNSTRILGRSRIRMQCAVCGGEEIAIIRMPRFGPVPDLPSGRHPAREDFLRRHAHPSRPHPMAWALPLLNSAAHEDGIDLDLLGMRLEGDLNQERGEAADGQT